MPREGGETIDIAFRPHDAIAAVTAVATARSAARCLEFLAETGAAVTAVAPFNVDRNAVEKHAAGIRG